MNCFLSLLVSVKGYENVDDFAKIDHERQKRTFIPEVIFGEGKSTEQVVKILIAMWNRSQAIADDSKRGMYSGHGSMFIYTCVYFLVTLLVTRAANGKL